LPQAKLARNLRKERAAFSRLRDKSNVKLNFLLGFYYQR
jgi:hypothetical protein